MPLFDGIVEIADDSVPVILGIEEDELRLSANGTEIGEWAKGEYRLEPGTDGASFIIAADGDTLTFKPSRPDAFARALGIEAEPERSAPDAPGARVEAATPAQPQTAPPPRPFTRALFYTLAGTTALLGIWALLRLFL